MCATHSCVARADTPPSLLHATLTGCLEQLLSLRDSLHLITGSQQALRQMQLIATVLKHGAHREQLLAYTQTVFDNMQQLQWNRCDASVRKMVVKILQRVALTCLPVSDTKWRYMRGGRSLVDNLQQGGAADTVQEPVEDDEFDVSELVEKIIAILLDATGDKDTIVRSVMTVSPSRIHRTDGRRPKDLVASALVYHALTPIKLLSAFLPPWTRPAKTNVDGTRVVSLWPSWRVAAAYFPFDCRT